MTMDQNSVQPVQPIQPMQPMQPAQPVQLAQPVKKQPSIIGIIIGIVLIIAGPICIVLAAISFAAGPASSTEYLSDGLPAVVSLNAGDETGIWIEHTGYGYCNVYDPMMDPVTIDTNVPSESVNDYDLAATFVPGQSGLYTVTCTSGLYPFFFKVAPTMNVAGFVIGLVIGILAIPIGAILLIVTLVRRSSWKRRNAQPATVYPVQPPWQPQPVQLMQPGQPVPPVYAQPAQPTQPGQPVPPTYAQPAQPPYITPTQSVQPTPPTYGVPTPAPTAPIQPAAPTYGQPTPSPVQPPYGTTPQSTQPAPQPDLGTTPQPVYGQQFPTPAQPTESPTDGLTPPQPTQPEPPTFGTTPPPTQPEPPTFGITPQPVQPAQPPESTQPAQPPESTQPVQPEQPEQLPTFIPPQP